MDETPDPTAKNQELRDSAARLIHESRKLREAARRIMEEAEDLKKLVPEKQPKKDGN